MSEQIGGNIGAKITYLAGKRVRKRRAVVEATQAGIDGEKIYRVTKNKRTSWIESKDVYAMEANQENQTGAVGGDGGRHQAEIAEHPPKNGIKIITLNGEFESVSEALKARIQGQGQATVKISNAEEKLSEMGNLRMPDERAKDLFTDPASGDGCSPQKRTGGGIAERSESLDGDLPKRPLLDRCEQGGSAEVGADPQRVEQHRQKLEAAKKRILRAARRGHSLALHAIFIQVRAQDNDVRFFKRLAKQLGLRKRKR